MHATHSLCLEFLLAVAAIRSASTPILASRLPFVSCQPFRPSQVMGGMVGTLLVEPADGYALPADFAALYAAARVLVLNHIFLESSDGEGPFGLIDLP